MREHFFRMLAVATAALLLAAAPRTVLAAPISLDNDVDINWSQVGPEACEAFGLCNVSVDVVGAPRLVADASRAGNDVFFDIDVVSPQFFNGLFLRLHVGDSSFEELIDAGGAPLLLDFAVFAPDFAPFIGQAVNGVASRRITLDQFANFAALPQGVDVVFSISGFFSGSSFACANCGGGNVPYGATVRVSGAGTPVPVPEPATSGLLLTGIAVGLSSEYARRVRGARKVCD